MSNSEFMFFLYYVSLCVICICCVFRDSKLKKNNKELEDINRNLTIEIQNLIHENTQLKTKSNYEELVDEVKKIIQENNKLRNQSADTK